MEQERGTDRDSRPDRATAPARSPPVFDTEASERPRDLVPMPASHVLSLEHAESASGRSRLQLPHPAGGPRARLP